MCLQQLFEFCSRNELWRKVGGVFHEVLCNQIDLHVVAGGFDTGGAYIADLSVSGGAVSVYALEYFDAGAARFATRT